MNPPTCVNLFADSKIKYKKNCHNEPDRGAIVKYKRKKNKLDSQKTSFPPTGILIWWTKYIMHSKLNMELLHHVCTGAYFSNKTRTREAKKKTRGDGTQKAPPKEDALITITLYGKKLFLARSTAARCIICIMEADPPTDTAVTANTTERIMQKHGVELLMVTSQGYSCPPQS